MTELDEGQIELLKQRLAWLEAWYDLDRYCGRPDARLIPALEALAQINEDLYHDRKPLDSSINAILKAVKEISR